MKPLTFKEIVMTRHAARSFDGKIVPEKDVAELMELIRHAPSSFNLQPWKVIVVKDLKVKEELSAAAYGQPQIISSSHLLVFCADTDIESHIIKLEKATGSADYAKMLRDFDQKLTPEKRLTWAQRQTYLALGNAVNGTKALGFDSCPMEGFDATQFSKILGLPSNIVPTALCPIGYANHEPRPKLRLDVEDVFL